MQKLVLCLSAVLFSFALQAQSASIRGSITDETEQALVGASVLIANTGTGTTTDLDGKFELSNLKAGAYTLLISYVGYESSTYNVELADGETQDLKVALAESTASLSTITVSAQKREQRIQDVPIALTSFGGQFLQSTNITEYDAFSDYVPGLQIQIQSVNNPGVVIRGITSDDGDSRVEPRVSVFQDGVSISKSRGSVVELFDIDRIEVLKGPQGTLFGRGAQIGAMHIIQNKPNNTTSGRIKVGFGNFNQQQYSGFFNTPLIDQKLFFRVAGIYKARDGFIENLSGGTLNGKETLAFRGSLRYLISDKTSADLIFNWQEDTPPGTSFKSGTYAPAGGDTSPFTFADMERGEDLFIDRQVWGATGTVRHRFSEAWSLTSITAFRRFDSFESFDADGTVAPVLWFGEDAKGDQFSQEFRFNFSNNSNVSGFLGTSLFYEDGSQRVPWEVDERSLFALYTPFFAAAGVPFTPLITEDGKPFLWEVDPITMAPLKSFHEEEFTNFGTSYAYEIFGDLTYSPTPKFDITVGIRGTYEDITGGYNAPLAADPGRLSYVLGGSTGNNLFIPTDGKVEVSETFTSAVGRVAFNYDITSGITAFANVARGRRPNVINITATDTTILDAETVWSYELGFKTLSKDKRFSLDINGFIYDYSNFQTSVVEIDRETGEFISQTKDSGEASAAGFEAAVSYNFTNSISAFANYGYIDATFDDVDSDGVEQELAGNTFRLTPKHSFSAGVNINTKIAKDLRFNFTPTISYKSKVFFEEDNQDLISQDAYSLLNLKAGFTYKGKYNVSFFGNNLLDEEYIIDAGNTGGAFGIPTFIAGPPRMVGVQLSADF
ncbi:MAG: TonB-dependent receptor [Saprospiraceae bacterium]|nr:TonB-dependent receptor [Saprospiraceae bacterium]